MAAASASTGRVRAHHDLDLPGKLIGSKRPAAEVGSSCDGHPRIASQAKTGHTSFPASVDRFAFLRLDEARNRRGGGCERLRRGHDGQSRNHEDSFAGHLACHLRVKVETMDTTRSVPTVDIPEISSTLRSILGSWA
jgi:hypothetical protein